MTHSVSNLFEGKVKVKIKKENFSFSYSSKRNPSRRLKNNFPLYRIDSKRSTKKVQAGRDPTFTNRSMKPCFEFIFSDGSGFI